MDIGMLWFDSDPKTEPARKIERAVAYYQKKYGRNPTLCYVHPSMMLAFQGTRTETVLPESPANYIRAGGVEVRQNRSILPNHFWIGVNGVGAT